jgi:hypothetical protein
VLDLAAHRLCRKVAGVQVIFLPQKLVGDFPRENLKEIEDEEEFGKVLTQLTDFWNFSSHADAFSLEDASGFW